MCHLAQFSSAQSGICLTERTNHMMEVALEVYPAEYYGVQNAWTVDGAWTQAQGSVEPSQFGMWGWGPGFFGPWAFGRPFGVPWSGFGWPWLGFGFPGPGFGWRRFGPWFWF